MNNNSSRRYCLHCQIFGETRQEMNIKGLQADVWEAECPKCGSLEYFVKRQPESESVDLPGLSSLFG